MLKKFISIGKGKRRSLWCSLQPPSGLVASFSDLCAGGSLRCRRYTLSNERFYVLDQVRKFITDAMVRRWWLDIEQSGSKLSRSKKKFARTVFKRLQSGPGSGVRSGPGTEVSAHPCRILHRVRCRVELRVRNRAQQETEPAASIERSVVSRDRAPPNLLKLAGVLSVRPVMGRGRKRVADADAPVGSIARRNKRAKRARFLYPAHEVSKRQSKLQANVCFRDAVSKHCERQPSGTILYLDGQDLNTTGHLADVAPQHQRCIVNFDHKVFSEALRSPDLRRKMRLHPPTLFPGAVRSFLSTCPRDSLAAVWLDYCCTLDGGRRLIRQELLEYCPRTDIEMALGNGCLRDGGVFAITICTRDGRRNKTTDSRGLPAWFLETCRRHYSESRLLETIRYHSMVFVLVHLKHPIKIKY